MWKSILSSSGIRLPLWHRCVFAAIFPWIFVLPYSAEVVSTFFNMSLLSWNIYSVLNRTLSVRTYAKTYIYIYAIFLIIYSETYWEIIHMLHWNSDHKQTQVTNPILEMISPYAFRNLLPIQQSFQTLQTISFGNMKRWFSINNSSHCWAQTV